MSQTRYIHNISGGQKTYRGVPIADGAFYEIELANLSWYQTSDDVLADLAVDEIRMSADGTTDYSTSTSKNIAYLLGSDVTAKDANNNLLIINSGVNEPNNYRARMKGLGSWTVPNGTTYDCDYQMEQLAWLGTNKKSYFDGVEYYAKDAVIGDYVKFQVVDKDGLVYPAGTVLEEFGDTWHVMPDESVEIRLFKSSIISGMYIRIKYTSTGGTDVKFVGNLFRFIKTDEDV